MGPSIASGPPDAEEDERGLPRREAATTIDTATAEEDVKDFDCARLRFVTHRGVRDCVDGRGGRPPWRSSLVLLGLLWNPPVDFPERLQIKYPREGLY